MKKLQALNKRTAPKSVMPEKIIQFGEGNFLRAFVDWIVYNMNQKTDFNGSVVVVQPLANGMIDWLNGQDCLYHVNLQGLEDGKPVNSLTRIDVISRALNPYSQNQAFMALADQPEIRFVISNTTEAGIAFDPTCKLDDAPASSYPGKLVQLLYRRYQTFNGDPTKGLIIFPCELIFLNGKTQIPIEEACPGCICGVAKLRATKTGDTLGESPKCHVMSPMTFPSPVFSYAVSAVKSGDEDKIMNGLQKLCECDPTLHIELNKETHETIFSGMGELHLQIALRRLKEIARVEVQVSAPKIPYREAINGRGEGHYRHKKQSGGHGQFAEVFLRIEPSGERFEFANAVVGGAIPKNFIPAVEKGVVEAMECGPLAGCVVENVKVTVYDGKFHDVDSSEMAFKIAARKAFREAMEKANPVLKEPVMSVKIYTPAEFMGDITGHLNHKRGRIIGMSAEDGMQVLEAEVPLAELSKYATELRSMTQGRGTFEMEFARYEVVAPNVAAEIINKFKASHKEEED